MLVPVPRLRRSRQRHLLSAFLEWEGTVLETALLPGDGALRVRRGRPGARLNLPDAPDGFTLAHRAAGETWVHVPPAAQAACEPREGAAVPLSARSLRLDPDAPLRVTLGGFTVRFELLDRRRLPRRSLSHGSVATLALSALATAAITIAAYLAPPPDEPRWTKPCSVFVSYPPVRMLAPPPLDPSPLPPLRYARPAEPPTFEQRVLRTLSRQRGRRVSVRVDAPQFFLPSSTQPLLRASPPSVDVRRVALALWPIVDDIHACLEHHRTLPPAARGTVEVLYELTRGGDLQHLRAGARTRAPETAVNCVLDVVDTRRFTPLRSKTALTVRFEVRLSRR